MTTPDSQEQQSEAELRKRKIRSFVRREGRLTKGQEKAMAEQWPIMGIEYQPQLLDLDQVFQRSAPRVLEIGFGMGGSLVEMAKAAPEWDYMGIEVHTPGVGACLMAAAQAELRNLRVMCHDAVEVFEHMLAEQSLERVQLFFPDPWHKARHHKRRIVQPAFVEMVHTKLKVGGEFHMATDWENYAEHMLEVMNAAPGYSNAATSGDYMPRPDYRPLTKFEQRGHRLGHGVWDLIFTRTA